MNKKITSLLAAFVLSSLSFPQAMGAPYSGTFDELYRKGLALYRQIERDNEHSVIVNDIEMTYVDFGPKGGTPLLWAHGSGSTRLELLNVVEGLTASGYRVIAIDYRGHGKTQISNYDVSLYHVADDMAALLDHLGIKKSVIGGLSLGGWAAAMFYDQYPQRTLGLLLEDGGSFSIQKLRDEAYIRRVDFKKDKEKHAQAIQDLIRELDSSYDSLKEGVHDKLTRWYPDSDSLSPEIVATVISRFKRQPNGKWRDHVNYPALLSGEDHKVFRQIDGPLTTGFLPTPSQFPLMAWSQQAMIPATVFRSLHVPLYIVDPLSENDLLPATEQNLALKALHPDLVVHEIYENTGHSAHFDRPDRFIASAKALLTRVVTKE